jgi:asparagine synthase (glutamine-hydrolysing)
MSMAHGLEARVPFLDTDSVKLAFSLPTDVKIRRNGKAETEKYILRQAFDGLLPENVAWRRKMQFAQGAGSMNFLAQMAEAQISDHDYAAESHTALDETGHRIRSKEELLNYRLFRQHFPEPQTVSLVDFWPGQ